MKLLGTILLILSLTGCDATQRGFEQAYGKVISWEAQNSYPEESGPFNAEIHPCVGMDVKAGQLYDVMLNVKTEDEKDAIINRLQKYVSQDRSLVVLQGGAEFLYETNPMPSKDSFIAAAKDVCVKKFGSIMDRNHV